MFPASTKTMSGFLGIALDADAANDIQPVARGPPPTLAAIIAAPYLPAVLSPIKAVGMRWGADGAIRKLHALAPGVAALVFRLAHNGMARQRSCPDKSRASSRKPRTDTTRIEWVLA